MGVLKTNPNTVSDEIKDKINSITEAVSTQVLTGSMTVYRGESIQILKQLDNFDEVEKAILKKDIKAVVMLLKSKIVQQNRFMSTSTSIDKAKEYAKGNKESRILWTLNLPKGTKAIKTHDISTKKYEKEILLQRDSNLEIKRIKHKNGIWHIEADIESTI